MGEVYILVAQIIINEASAVFNNVRFAAIVPLFHFMICSSKYVLMIVKHILVLFSACSRKHNRFKISVGSSVTYFANLLNTTL